MISKITFINLDYNLEGILLSVLKMYFCKQKIKVDLNKLYDIITSYEENWI